ncbi:YeiH family protein [Arthrobacter sp. LS16]|nr:membrane protein [Arthrobacter sp. LS16]
MQSTDQTQTTSPTSTRATLRTLFPGLAVCLLAGALCMVISRFLDGVSALLLAIVLGALWRNIVPVPTALEPGIAVSGKKLLRLGIVLLGLQLSLGTILGLGPGVLLVVFLSVGVTFFATLWIGSRLGMDLPQRLLIAAGFSICGAAAVAGAENVVRAKQSEVATAVGLVVLFGTLMIPAMPALGALLQMDERSIGMLVGASTHEVAHVVAAGGSVGAAALEVAVTVKLARVVLLAPIIAGVGMFMRRRHAVTGGKNPPLVPLFVLGFIAAMLLRTSGIVPVWALDAGQMLQTLLLSSAMFALGLGVHLRSIVKTGGKSLLLGLLATIVITVVSVLGTLAFPPQ